MRGQKMLNLEKLGFALATLGFVYLLLPGLNMPPLGAATFMTISGISWGLYSLLGQGAKSPILTTSQN